jgi:hypothetical protein
LLREASNADDGPAAVVAPGNGELEVRGGEQLRRGVLQLDEADGRDRLANPLEDLMSASVSLLREERQLTW